MFGSNYAPEKGTPGGSVVIADWQIPDQLNYYYQNAFVNQQVISATMDSLWTVSSDFKYIPQLAVSIPTLDRRQPPHRRGRDGRVRPPARRACPASRSTSTSARASSGATVSRST